MKIVSSSRQAAAKAATMCGLKRRQRGRGSVLPVVFINYTRQQHGGMHCGREGKSGGEERGEEKSRLAAASLRSRFCWLRMRHKFVAFTRDFYYDFIFSFFSFFFSLLQQQIAVAKIAIFADVSE